MTILCPVSALIRIGLWLAAIALVLGATLRQGDAPSTNQPTPDSIASTQDSGVHNAASGTARPGPK